MNAPEKNIENTPPHVKTHDATCPHRPGRHLIMWITLCLIGTTPALAQDTLTLSQCYDLLDRTYPLVRQKQLFARSAEFSKDALQKNYLPQVSLNAQATYQSDVPHVPFSPPGADIPLPNKDQYRATVDLNQLLYDGGAVKHSIEVEDLNMLVAQQQVDVSLHQLKTRVNQAYFTVLLLQEKYRLLSLSEENLNARLREVQSAIKNGTAVPASGDVLYAEMLQARQQLFETEADKDAALNMLSDLIGQNLEINTALARPHLEPDYSGELSRPELNLYALQQQQVDATSQLMGNAKTPKFSLFAQGGYGNPGLNLLDNTFQPFFMGGVRLSWKILDWHLVSNQQQSLLVRKEIIDTQRQAFDLNANIELNRHRNEIEKLQRLLQTDDEIIALRRNVLQTARSQLQNGTITASQYIIEANALDQSLIRRKTHEITLLQAEADYITIQGNISKP